MLKPEVLRNKKDFSALYDKGKSVGERCLVLIYRKNGLSYNRRAFLASKKVGRSVQRNRARRLLRESFRSIENQLEPGYDLLFIARNTIVNLKYADVKKSMEAAIKKAKLFKSKVR
ncbi:MAG: ribonuclease P protein component [Anaerovoracaceae bacterium]|jgi:ribonuclease P protein component